MLLHRSSTLLHGVLQSLTLLIKASEEGLRQKVTSTVRASLQVSCFVKVEKEEWKLRDALFVQLRLVSFFDLL